MTITVQKVGGTNPFTQSQSIDAVSQNSITIGAPNDPDENVTINQLGFDAGGLSQVSVGTPISSTAGLFAAHLTSAALLAMHNLRSRITPSIGTAARQHGLLSVTTSATARPQDRI